jgi:hypothetical protein
MLKQRLLGWINRSKNKLNTTVLLSFRGRLKQLSYQTAKKASRINLFIFLRKPIKVACWCLLIDLSIQTERHRP